MGRTVRLAGVWWGVWCGCDGPVWCFVASCVRIGERPWPWMLAGALIPCWRVTRLARGRDSPTLRVRSLITWAAKRGADACAVGGDAYAAALNGEVRVFCFPTVACCVVGEERGAQVAVKHGVQRNRFDCFLLIVVIAGFSICFGLFDPCGGDRLTVFDCVSRSEREAAAGSGFLGPGFTEDVVCAGFVADGDGVAIRDGERDRAVACGGFRDGDSGEHVGERLCRLVVGVSVHGVHGACFLFCVGVRFYCSTQARVLSTRVRVGVGTWPLMWDRPSSCLAGAVFLARLTPVLMRCARLAIGALPVWVDVRAVGSEGGLSARDGEVWVF